MSIPTALLVRVPVVGRIVRSRSERQAREQAQRERLARSPLSPRRVVEALRQRARDSIDSVPLLSPVIRRIEPPLSRTVRVVQVAREVRTPRTRWERLRDAAQAALDNPADAARWEQLMGLGVALAAGPAPPRGNGGRGGLLKKPLQRLLRAAVPDQEPARPARGLRVRLPLLQAPPPGHRPANKNGSGNRSRSRSDRLARPR